MSDQINLFDEIEAVEREERCKIKVRESYKKWLVAPELTPCSGALRTFDYNVHSHILHICDAMPENVYFWQNIVEGIHGGQYWVKDRHDTLGGGEQTDVCPYCGADLCHGEGARYLRKTDDFLDSQLSYREYYGLDAVDREIRKSQYKKEERNAC